VNRLVVAQPITPMHYPDFLTPVDTEKIEFVSGVSVLVPKTKPIFVSWTGHPPSDRYGNKPVVNVNGEPMFAELAVLRICESAGWQGVWVDTYRGKYRTTYCPLNEVELPVEQRRLLLRTYDKAGGRKGCWDVFCWTSNGDHLFAEVKRQGRDRIRDSQRKWLDAAIKCDLPIASFLIVEWST
jgi:hypothetical protein